MTERIFFEGPLSIRKSPTQENFVVFHAKSISVTGFCLMFEGFHLEKPLIVYRLQVESWGRLSGALISPPGWRLKALLCEQKKREPIMDISFEDIEHAFYYVSSNQIYSNSAILCRETGEIFYISEMGESEDDLPEDIEDPDKYISIPHKNGLDLGKPLVIEFTSQNLPEEIDGVYSIFSRKGAYSRFKELLERKGLLDKWYEFEDRRQKAVLKKWCRENKIRYTENSPGKIED